MRILICYRTNEELSPYANFHADYVVDLDKLHKFVTESEDNYYSKEEAELIIRLAEEKSKYCDYEWHDKYTFYDTPDELKLVLSEDQNNNVDYTVFAYLNY